MERIQVLPKMCHICQCFRFWEVCIILNFDTSSSLSTAHMDFQQLTVVGTRYACCELIISSEIIQKVFCSDLVSMQGTCWHKHYCESGNFTLCEFSVGEFWTR